MTSGLPKRLIEVDLPIKRISAHARREKSIRHGHISTLHIWWARRRAGTGRSRGAGSYPVVSEGWAGEPARARVAPSYAIARPAAASAAAPGCAGPSATAYLQLVRPQGCATIRAGTVGGGVT